MTGLAPPPRALVVLAGVVLVVGVGISVAGAWRTGVSWDETYHVMRMNNFLEHGWFLTDADLDGGTPGAWVEQRYVYAPVTMGLLHGWGMLWGTDTLGTVAATDRAYAVRHLGVVLLSLVGTAATAGLARLLLRSWGWALVAAAVLVAVPTWNGHAMFNIKDVPVATGYTLVTLGVCLVARAAPSSSHRRTTALGALLTLAGLVLAVGTRPGVWPGLALAGGVAVVVLAVRRRWARAVLLVALALTSVGALVLIYPVAFADPVTALVSGALESSRYGGMKGAWWYLPLYLVVELPTLLLLLGAAGAVTLARAVVRRTVADALVAALVLLQTFLLPVLAVARESNLYTGLRQLLFAAPGLAVLATVALALLWSGRRDRPAALPRLLVPVVTVVALGAPLLAQAQLFPYSYAFSSVPASLVSPRLAAQDRDLEVQTDYWRTSVRELAPSVPAGALVTCTPRIDDQDRFLPQADESRADCVIDPIGPLAPYAAARGTGGPGAPAPGPTRFLAVDAGSAFVGANCTPLDRVTRRLWWRTVTMSSVSDCDLVLADYPADLDTGVTFDGAGQGAGHLRGAWSLLRSEPGIGLMQGTAQVGLTLPAQWQGRTLQVTGTALGASGLQVGANGVAVPVRTAGERFDLTVPAPVAAAYGEGRLLLDVGDTGPEPDTGAPDLRLLTLAVRPSPPAPTAGLR